MGGFLVAGSNSWQFELGIDVFVPNLIDRLLFVSPCIESVGQVQNISVPVAHVAIGVDDARRHENGHRVLFTDQVDFVAFGMAGAVLPKVKLVASAEENEEVGLVDMLMRTSRDAGMGDADVTHHGHSAVFDFVLAEDLGEPSARIRELL